MDKLLNRFIVESATSQKHRGRERKKEKIDKKVDKQTDRQTSG